MKKATMILCATILAFGFSLELNAQEKQADLKKTSIKWTGKKVTGEHYGKISLKEGSFTVKDNKIVSGSFKIDMGSLTVEDLTDPEYNAKLVGHLKSDDFFGVDKHPYSVLKIIGSTNFKNGVATIDGDLTIKGKSHPISFDAKKEGDHYSATIVIDRTLYDVRYGSGKFFEDLGDKMIYDDFTLEVKLVTK